MAKTKTEMFTLIGANLPDNTTGLITPAALREVMTQMADSPIYATPGVKEVEVLRATSTVIQAPTVTDTALQLTFGSAQGSASDPVMINAAGLVTFNTAGNYAVRIKLQAGRTGASGTSILLSRILLNGAQYGSATEYGKWHNVFTRDYLPIGEFETNDVGNLVHKKTKSEDYRQYIIRSDKYIPNTGFDL